MNRIKILIIFLLFGSLSIHSQDRSRAEVTLTTNRGKIVLELYNETPLHRDNFIKRIKSGILNGATFYRVIEDFMIQFGPYGGEDTPDGKEVADKESVMVPAEFRYPEIYHRRGVLAAAREGDDVNPEQKSSALHFYIVWGKTHDNLTHVRQRIKDGSRGKYEMTPALEAYYQSNPGTPHLDGSYTVFGEVTKGLERVGEIQKVKTNENDRPLEDVVILKAKVTRKGRF